MPTTFYVEQTLFFDQVNKMHTCFDPVIVYGILEEDRNKMLDEEFLQSHGLLSYAQDIVKGYAGNFIYGVALSIEEVIKGETSEEVKKFANDYSFSEPQYYLALTGDYQTCHDVYNPDEDKVSDTDEISDNNEISENNEVNENTEEENSETKDTK